MHAWRRRAPPESAPTPGREIRADLLRYLILGGCEDCNVEGWGVNLCGAYVTGEPDLSFAKARGATGLINCRFDSDLVGLQTRFKLLNLSGSTLLGLNAQGAKVADSVFIRNVTARKSVSISGAEIGGQLSFSDADFEATQGGALNAEDVRIRGGVFLTDITARTRVSLSGASIGGQLDCTRARFEAPEGVALNLENVRVRGNVRFHDVRAQAPISLIGATIDGQLECTGALVEATQGVALDFQSLNVEGGLLWRRNTVANGIVNLAAAHVGDLVDDPQSWPEKGRLILDGFTYDRISGGSPTDARTRIAWLEKGTTWNGKFFPQPYSHLAKVLREMGHDSDARAVLAERERLLFREKFTTRWILHNGVEDDGVPNTNTNYLTILWSYLLQYTVGYGHRPFRSVIALLLLWACATVFAHLAWDEGSFAPNSGPVLLSEDWQIAAALEPPANPAKFWAEKGNEGQDWESFSSLAYAADLVIPIVDIGQTAAWAPSTTRGFWGYQLWWLRWVFTIAGWVVTALGAAAITGIIRRD